jgi:hypothetical protein
MLPASPTAPGPTLLLFASSFIAAGRTTEFRRRYIFYSTPVPNDCLSGSITTSPRPLACPTFLHPSSRDQRPRQPAGDMRYHLWAC